MNIRPSLQVEIRASSRSYPIYIGSELIPKAGGLLDEQFSPRMLVIADENVDELYADSLLSAFRAKGFRPQKYLLPSGEGAKTLGQAEKIYDAAIDCRLDRHSPLVALGGGVTGDITGFVAATLYRGVPFFQVPTTLLAQVDSSVGGKVAVNHSSGKNLIGAFYQPRAVIADTGTFHTLPAREFRTGMAEVIKYGMIREASFFRYLEDNMGHIMEGEDSSLRKVVHTCCRIKAEIVEQDERESGLRTILNYGHTVGHALERLYGGEGHRELNHGEAVALGMSVSARIAVKRNMIPTATECRQNELLRAAGLDLQLPPVAPGELLPYIRHDKKNVRDRIRFILPCEIGSVEIIEDMDPEEIVAAISELQE